MAEDFFVQLRSWGPIKENQAALLRKKISDPNWAGDGFCFCCVEIIFPDVFLILLVSNHVYK